MASGDTRERLILAAEHLFATRGVQGVSLREINVAAGQKNTSASHYHFGSKDALVFAVLDYRDADLRAQRIARLEEIDTSDVDDLPRAVVEAFVLPTTDLMDSAPDFVLFLAQVYLQPPADWRELVKRQDTALVKAARMLAGCVALPDRLLLHRLVLLTQQIATSVAAHVRVSQDGGDDGLPLPRDVFIFNLIDTLTAYLIAQASDRTLAALAASPGIAPNLS